MTISNQSAGLRAGVCTSSTRPVTPYEGQVIYETDTDRTLVWNNAAWVDPSTGKSGRAGLVLIKTDNITSGTSKEITSIFSSDFNNYLIIVDGVALSGVNNAWMRLGSTSSGYYSSGVYVQYGTGNPVNADTTPVNGNKFTTGCIADSTGHGSAVINIMNPFSATRTGFHSSGVDARTGGGGARVYNGYLNDASSYSSVTFLTDSAVTFLSCNIAVYGYNR